MAFNKKRRSTTVIRPLHRQKKHKGQSVKALTSSGSPYGNAISSKEQNLVIDRLARGILPFFSAGGLTGKDMKSRLRMGINEVTRYLEAIATAQGLNLSKAKERREIKGSTSRPRPGKAIFLFCNDVQPPRIKDHLHVLAAVTGTPYILLPNASRSLGKMFGLKSVTALAICPRPAAVSPLAAETCVADGGDDGGVAGGGETSRPALHQGDGGDVLKPEPEPEPESESDPAKKLISPIDEEIDSLIYFLQEKAEIFLNRNK